MPPRLLRPPVCLCAKSGVSARSHRATSDRTGISKQCLLQSKPEMNTLQGSQSTLQGLQRPVQRQSLVSHRVGSQVVQCQQQAHRTRESLCGTSRTHAQRRATRLTQYCSAGAGTWPAESTEGLQPIDENEAIQQLPTADQDPPKTSFDSTDEAATRVGLSSKGSKRLAGFWGAYSKALEETPIRVKSATSFFGFLIGDAVAQIVVGNPYNYLRTLRMVVFGVLMDGPVGHLWYSFLDTKVYPDKPKSNKAVLAKMLADQLLWAPFFSCVFFAVIKTLEGTPSLIIPTIKAKLLKTLIANYAIWPLAHIINFKFIPSSQRILYINCVQVIWSAYLSNMSSKA